MTRRIPPRPLGPLLLLAAGLVVGCGAAAPASLLLTVRNGSDAPPPDSLWLQVFDRSGPAHEAASFPVHVGSGGTLGTVVVYPRPGGSLSLRIQAEGLQQDRVVSQGATGVVLAVGTQRRAEIVLAADKADVDGDGDGVADTIDNCTVAANPRQEDSDGDGVGDGCLATVDAGASDGGDGAVPDGSRDGTGALAVGTPCGAGDRCESGFCTDGVCCEARCDLACHACNLPERMGRCSPVEAGQIDGSGGCLAQSPESCGFDGTCDGKGACRKHLPGTVCVAATCSGPAERALPGTCNGSGACMAGTRQSCAPYLCSGGACATTCSGPSSCTSGNQCIAGSCGKAPLGAGCSSGDVCNSGYCVDGVCCDVATCAGPCRACNVAGAAGSCVSFPANAAPRSDGCPWEAAATCGRTGRCDGSGACQLYNAGAPCGPRTCSGETETPAPTCNGTGQCVAGTTRGCGSYLCQDDACGVSCAGDGDCAQAAFCEAALCVPRRASGDACSEARSCASDACVNGHCCQQPSCPAGQYCTGPGGTCENKLALGARCVLGSSCGSGFCSDGVCCDVACTDPCRRCDLAPAGSCQAITSGRDPNASPPCTAPRRCNVAGVCQ